MYQSKNCAYGFDLYIEDLAYNSTTKEIKPCGFIEYKPIYCPICGKKVEGGE